MKGNRGEWSEFYAFLKILSAKKLYAADKELNKIPDKFFEVLQIIREEAASGKIVYDLVEFPGTIVILSESGERIDQIDSSAVSSKVDKIFERIKNSSETTFEVPLADDAMSQLHCTQIKAGSSKKADLFLKIYDSISPTTPDLGFSIKSMLGSSSTLLNASGATNFVYKLSKPVNMGDLNSIEGKSKLRDRMAFLKEKGVDLMFSHMDSKEFERNLRMVDTMFPQMMALVMKTYFEEGGGKIQDNIHSLEERGVLREMFRLSGRDFSYKIKLFLMSVALGMTPKSEWNGLTEAHGGYIIVKENGEVVCYHLYNRDQFEEYLYENTRLETPSTSRHGFGTVYEENGEQYIKLNLQIRFIK